MKYVLVTGACGGMGNATVDLLLSKGYTIFALDLNAVPARERVIPIAADITDALSLQKAFALISDVTDTLNAIIHFAGVYMLDSLIEISEERITKAFDINVFGAYRVNKIFAPLLKKEAGL